MTEIAAKGVMQTIRDFEDRASRDARLVEYEKALADAVAHGAGWIKVNHYGGFRHVPFTEIRETREAQSDG